MFNFDNIIAFIKEIYSKETTIGLHRPLFIGNEKKYILDTIDSTFVSSVGQYVDLVENTFATLTKTNKAVAVVNGTAGLQIALKLVGVKPGDEVITQSLTFVATANSIIYNGANPLFLDVDKETMGLSHYAVEIFLENFGEIRNDGFCYNKKSNKRISACLPMHTFGFPVDIKKLMLICKKWNIPIVEDSAEALGSEVGGDPIGSFGEIAVFSFNGNKIITSGGGGMLVSNNLELMKRAKHITTTAKVPHQFEFIHDEIGYNFRMPNLNAALLHAQTEQLSFFLESKRQLAVKYNEFFTSLGIKFKNELPGTKANYWLMCIELNDRNERDKFLTTTNQNNVFTRPIWRLIHELPMYSEFYSDEQINAKFLENRIVNIPSSVTL